jgi:hypothetical protein
MQIKARRYQNGELRWQDTLGNGVEWISLSFHLAVQPQV